MKLTIHIEIGDYKNISYKKEILSWMREKYPHLITFDFDNHSETTVINYAIDLLKQGEEIFIIMDILPEGNSKPLLRFLDALTRQRGKSVFIIINGEDQLINKMMKVFDEGSVMRNVTPSVQKEKLKVFFRLT